MSLEKAAEKIKKDSINAWMRRVNWRFMDERIQIEFDRCRGNNESINLLGGLYIHRAKDDEPLRSADLIGSQYINSTHILTGHRFLGINVIDSEKGL